MLSLFSRNAFHQRSRSVFQNELRLIFDRDQFFERTFADQNAMRENSDAVTNLLCLGE